MGFLRENPKSAADAVQGETRTLGREGGVIVLDPNGNPAWSFNTPGRYRGMMRAGAGPVVAIYGDE